MDHLPIMLKCLVDFHLDSYLMQIILKFFQRKIENSTVCHMPYNLRNDFFSQ